MHSSTLINADEPISAILQRPSSIRKKLIRGFSVVAVAIALSLTIILLQMASLVSDGYEVLGTYQPVKMHTYAVMSGMQHTVAVLNRAVTEGNNDVVVQADEVWKKEVQTFVDSIQHNADKWSETPKKRVAFQLLDQIKTLRVTLDNAKSLTETVDLSSQEIARRATVDSTGDAASTEVVKDAIKITYRPQLATFMAEKVLPAHQEINALAISLINANQQDIDQFEVNVGRKNSGLKVSAFLMLLALLATIAVTIRMILKGIQENINKMNAHIGQLAQGMVPGKLETMDTELDNVIDSVNLLTDNLRSIKDFAQHVGQGNFENEIKVFNDAGDLGESLARMRDELKQVSEKDKIRYWTNEGLAKFGEILRENDKDLKTLSDQLISQLVKYLNANQGGVFVINKEDQQRHFLELTACYAYDRKKFLQKEILPGQGLVGQAWQEADTIYLRDIPQSYVRITSGLGGSTPKYLLIIPLKLNGEVYGVIELASFHDIESYKIEFTQKIAESIASTIAGARVAEQTQLLLQEAQEMTEQMRAQEEEMRQNMEELQATQEEMHRSQRETAEKLEAAQKENELLLKKLRELEKDKK